MLVMTKKTTTIFFDSVDYQNAGLKMNFSECFHARSLSMFCDVRVCYRLMAVVVKAMHTTSTHNILLKSLFSDVCT